VNRLEHIFIADDELVSFNRTTLLSRLSDIVDAMGFREEGALAQPHYTCIIPSQSHFLYIEFQYWRCYPSALSALTLHDIFDPGHSALDLFRFHAHLRRIFLLYLRTNSREGLCGSRCLVVSTQGELQPNTLRLPQRSKLYQIMLKHLGFL
jgi:hypothetical protein